MQLVFNIIRLQLVLDLYVRWIYLYSVIILTCGVDVPLVYIVYLVYLQVRCIIFTYLIHICQIDIIM